MPEKSQRQSHYVTVFAFEASGRAARSVHADTDTSVIRDGARGLYLQT